MLPVVSQFAASAGSCSKSFLTLKTWFAYLPSSAFNSDCSIKDFDVLGSHSWFLLIGLAILDDLLRIAALVAVAFVIWGGIQYVVSQGAPDQTKRAQQTIINALIGLVVALMATAIVAFIGKTIG